MRKGEKEDKQKGGGAAGDGEEAAGHPDTIDLDLGFWS